jgi:hypothetical protein
MKKAVTAAAVLLLAVLFSATAHASGSPDPDTGIHTDTDTQEIIISQYEALGLDDLKSSLGTSYTEPSPLEDFRNDRVSMRNRTYIPSGSAQIGGISKVAVGSAVLIIIMQYYSPSPNSDCEAGSDGGSSELHTLAECLPFLCRGRGCFNPTWLRVDSTLTEQSDFSKSCFPRFLQAAAASGQSLRRLQSMQRPHFHGRSDYVQRNFMPVIYAISRPVCGSFGVGKGFQERRAF